MRFKKIKARRYITSERYYPFGSSRFDLKHLLMLYGDMFLKFISIFLPSIISIFRPTFNSVFANFACMSCQSIFKSFPNDVCRSPSTSRNGLRRTSFIRMYLAFLNVIFVSIWELFLPKKYPTYFELQGVMIIIT